MISFLSFASGAGENALIKAQISHQAALWTEEEWRYAFFEQLNQLEVYLESEPLLDIVSWDVTADGAVESLRKLRNSYRDAFLMLVADSSMSPMAYLKPGILPTTLLLKPVSEVNLKQVLQEMMAAFVERFQEPGTADTFVIESREGKQFVPLGHIYYIEAREKKIYIRTRQEEYGFYETIENMEAKLPDTFRRCHRSYIVNMNKVNAVKASVNLIEIQDGIQIPLSRSYKKMIKEYHKHDRVG